MRYSRWQGPDRPVPNGPGVRNFRLPRNADAPTAARQGLEALRGQIDDDVLVRAQLCSSELVTNSVKYGSGREVRLDVWRVQGSLFIVASDDGPGFAAQAPEAEIAEMDGGFGLPLVDLLASAWGNGTRDDSWVWVEVAPRIGVTPFSARASGAEELLDIRMAIESIKTHALVALDRDGNVTNWGAGPAALLGFSAEEMLGRHVSELFMPASSEAFARNRELAESEGSHRSECWVRRADDTRFWAEVEIALIRDRSSRPRGLSMLISDLTARKRESDAREHLIIDLREQALTDDVTGLANRRNWMQVLSRELARARRNEAPLAVAMLDLDRFKDYNDAHGHQAGDDLLKAVAHNWSGAIRSSDLLARWGGDEFVLTLPDCPPTLAQEVIRRVKNVTPSAVAASTGVAHATQGDTVESLIRRADDALYEAKAHGRVRITHAAAREDTTFATERLRRPQDEEG